MNIMYYEWDGKYSPEEVGYIFEEFAKASEKEGKSAAALPTNINVLLDENVDIDYLKGLRDLIDDVIKKRKVICMKVIETNLIIHDGEIKDHQSMVIECDSWEQYVNSYVNYDGKTVEFKYVGDTFWCGVSIKRNRRITNLKYDDYHLSCDIENDVYEEPIRRLAYVF